MTVWVIVAHSSAKCGFFMYDRVGNVWFIIAVFFLCMTVWVIVADSSVFYV